jgi:hypothetical protein
VGMSIVAAAELAEQLSVCENALEELAQKIRQGGQEKMDSLSYTEATWTISVTLSLQLFQASKTMTRLGFPHTWRWEDCRGMTKHRTYTCENVLQSENVMVRCHCQDQTCPVIMVTIHFSCSPPMTRPHLC